MQTTPAAKTQPEHKNGRKPEPVVLLEPVGEFAGVAELSRGMVGAGDEDVGSQAVQLGDARTQMIQRQRMAVQIGQIQGNAYLQRVIQKATHHGNIHTNDLKGNGQSAETTGETEIDGLGTGGQLALVGVNLPPNGNGKKGCHSLSVIQREEDDKPTEEERARALAAAKVAQQVAGQAKSTGEAETVKSKNAGAAEAEAGKTAKGQAEQASTEAKSIKGKGRAEDASTNDKAAGPKGAAIEKTGTALSKNGKESAGETAGNAVQAGAEAAPVAKEKAPTSPEADLTFQTVVSRIKGTAAREGSHVPAASKAAEAQAASAPPANETSSKAQANQVGEMEQAETRGFDAKAFKVQLMERIQAMSPKSMKEADEFKKENKLGGLKGEMQGKVDQEKATSQGQLEQKTKALPDPSGIAPKPVTPLPPAEPGAAPADIGAESATPKPKTALEVEKPFQESSRSIDRQMAEADVTEKQLAKSNEPEFQGALASKKEAQAQAAQAPQEYRAFEGEQVDQAKGEAAGATQAQLQAMHGDRAALLTQVMGKQGGAKSEDEAARAKVAGDIQQIYDKTKTKVESILKQLDTDVDTTFDKGAEAAKQAFEDYVEAKMEAYKEDRYGGWFGWARWAKDKLLGMPSAVNAFYVEGRNLFLQKMDAVLDNVIAIIGRALAKAKAEVANGKKEIQAYVQKLPADLRKVGQQAASDIQDKFDQLESSIESKQNELVERLASKYNEKLQAVDARIEELKAANQGLVDKAINAVVGAVKAILRLKDLLFNVLARIADVVGGIIKDPIGFLGHLIDGVKLGLENFVSNLPKHLMNALVAWLTGTLGPMGIQIPEDIFSLEGIFSLVMQILGLTWDAIRAKAVKLLGEPVVKALETGFEIFQILINEGPIGLWKYVKEMIGNLKDMVIDAITDMIKTEVVQAGIKWILGLLTPAGAFIKAAMAIYDIVKFFIEKASQIGELINAIIDGIAAIARGGIGGAAKLIENALAKALPVVIGFLASLLGLGGLSKKVQGIIEKIRGKIDKAIDWVILKAKAAAGKVMGALGFGKDKKVEGVSAEQNMKARQLAREQVAKATQRPFKDESELKSTMSQIEKNLRPEGLQSLEIAPKQGQAGQYNVIAREDVGDAQVGAQGERVNVDSLRDYRPAWRESTKQELAAIYPEYHLSGTVTILFEKAISKKGELYNRAQFDRRHITAYSDLRNDLINRLHGKAFDEAATIMQNMGSAPKSLNNESILDATKKILSDKFNDITNLFVGDAQENQERGRQMADALTVMEQAGANGNVLAFNQAKAKYLAQGFDPEPIEYFYDKYKSIRERI